MAEPVRPAVALAPAADDAAVPGVLHRLLELIDEPLADLPPGAEVLIKPNLFQTEPRVPRESGAAGRDRPRGRRAWSPAGDRGAHARHLRDPQRSRGREVRPRGQLRRPAVAHHQHSGRDVAAGADRGARADRRLRLLHRGAAAAHARQRRLLQRDEEPGRAAARLHDPNRAHGRGRRVHRGPQPDAPAGSGHLRRNHGDRGQLPDGRARALGGLPGRQPQRGRPRRRGRRAGRLRPEQRRLPARRAPARHGPARARGHRPARHAAGGARLRHGQGAGRDRSRRVRASTSTPSTPARRAAGSWPRPCAHSPRSCAPGTAR